MLACVGAVREYLIEVCKLTKGFNKGNVDKGLVVIEQGETRSNVLVRYSDLIKVGKNCFTNSGGVEQLPVMW